LGSVNNLLFIARLTINQKLTRINEDKNKNEIKNSFKRKIGRPKGLVVENKKIAVKIRKNDENLTNNCINNES
jgi:hypothetical protein